jgi:exo-1,4-beta-D-glucosaminidase
MNIRSIPGTTYQVATNFSNFPMPKDSPFAVPWWYRTQFKIPGDYKGKTIWLSFGGINYRANFWLNGKQIANSNDIAGSWRNYELNVTEAASPARATCSPWRCSRRPRRISASPSSTGTRCRPDKNLGLWRGVTVSATGPAAVRHQAVMTKLSPANDKAELTVTAVVKNGTASR